MANDNNLVNKNYNEWRTGHIYPSPFFDVASTAMPKTIKELFLFCEYYYYNDGVIGTIVDKLTSYAITDFYFTIEDSGEVNKIDDATLDKIKEIFNELKIKELIQTIGLDYNIFGNSIIEVHQKFKRKFKCKIASCEQLSDLSEITSLIPIKSP